MIVNRKIIAVIGLTVLVVILGIRAFLYFGHNQNAEPLTVMENEGSKVPTPSVTPTPEMDYSDIQLSPSDNEGFDNLITEEKASVDKEALAEHEPEIGAVPEQTTTSGKSSTPAQAAEPEPTEEKNIEHMTKDELIAMLDEENLTKEQIIAIKTRLTELDGVKVAVSNPEVQEPVGEPYEIEETQPEPKKDKDGYIYTKEEAVEIFKTEFQKLIDTNDFNYTYARDAAIENGYSTQEEFEADLKQLLTNPYSSERLARAFDEYRKYGNIGVLITKASMWLSAGGDDGPWTQSYTQ